MDTAVEVQTAPDEEKDMFIGQYLLDKLKDQEVFICAVDPEIDLTNPFSKATELPKFQIHFKKDTYMLGTTVKRKFLWLTWDSVRPIADLTWIFYGGKLESLQIKSWNRHAEKFREKIIAVRNFLTSLPELDGCDVLVLE